MFVIGEVEGQLGVRARVRASTSGRQHIEEEACFDRGNMFWHTFGADDRVPSI